MRLTKVYISTKDEKYFRLKKKFNAFSFENFRLKISLNGLITVKASEEEPFWWDGCTPKFSIGQFMFGTPDGIALKDGARITGKASKLHDVIYQNVPRDKMTRRVADYLFYEQLRIDGFTFALPYYLVVRMFGWKFWNKYTKKLK